MTESVSDFGEPILFPALAGLVLSGQTMTGLLDLVVNLAVSVVDEVDQASVSIVHRDGKRFETANATSDDVREIDHVQYADSAGPCVAAIRTGTEIAVELPVPEWPSFSARAVERGVRSVTSLPLAAADKTLGALTSTRRRRRR